MSKHHELTGGHAIHPFAYVQDTDPSLDADNYVAAKKAWVDTSSGNVLKIRNDSNTGWIIIVAGGAGVSTEFVVLANIVIDPGATEFPNDYEEILFNLVNYI